MTALIQGSLDRQHTVSIALCEQAHSWAEPYIKQGAQLISLGPCELMDGADAMLARVIAQPDDLHVMADMAAAYANASAESCEAYLSALACHDVDVPDVIVYDADTPCGAHVGARFNIARVARLSTGIRHPALSPLHVPVFGTRVPRSALQYVPACACMVPSMAKLSA